jgi:hypothetical protein
MVTDEKESPTVGEVDLHPNQTVSVSRKMMEGLQMDVNNHPIHLNGRPHIIPWQKSTVRSSKVFQLRDSYMMGSAGCKKLLPIPLWTYLHIMW